MYGSVKNKIRLHYMDQSDIKYILELLNDAIQSKDWDIVEEAVETVKEFIDSKDIDDDE